MTIITYQQLIMMGFQDDIAFEAAQQYKNVNEAALFILNKQAISKQNSNKSSSSTTTYHERLNKIFNIKQNENNDVYDIICREYSNNGGIL